MQALEFVEREETAAAAGSSSSLLGISGIPGVGKTTLLRFVRDSYSHDLSFNHVFFVGASTVGRLQHVLCVNIGFAPPPQMSDVVPSMAQVIFTCLKRKTLLLLDDARERLHLGPFVGRLQSKVMSSYLKPKTFLLLLDDVRESIDLAAVGLPMPLGHKQKVIFTTRDHQICTAMGCTTTTNTIEMKCLGEDDACKLFKDNVGEEIINAHPHIDHLANKMVAECRGLPKALCTLGRAMSTKKDVKEWRYAYDVLKTMRPPANEIQEMDDEDYSYLHRLEEALRDSFL
ncbi:hypothetical protein U9M48_016419 [Paspalum notatum var. saurae]|uniref:NB-ARC domain-containing protein n=1 Tax=Paspalum notatum var. saurae TaxID=547442 RepID=A0AAQ3T646_PASNO